VICWIPTPNGRINAFPATLCEVEVAEPPASLHHPSQKSLANVRGVRVELVRIYREAKAGLLDPLLFGRLVNCLNTIQSMDNGLLLERRVEELETHVKPKPNGRAEIRP
jgi:hypothetical protein